MRYTKDMPTLSPIERRYQRAPEPSACRITPRVMSILAALTRYPVMTSRQIVDVDGGSAQKVVRLLKLLHDHGFVDRVGAPQLYPLSAHFDQRPLAYALGRKGASLLASAGIEVDTRIDRTTRNKRAVQIAHGIAITATMFSLEAACARAGVCLLDQPGLRTSFPVATRDLRKPLLLRSDVHPADYPQLRRLLKQEVSVAVEPDRIFGIQRPDKSGWMFALELDRASERVVPRRLSGSSILAKQLAYTSAWSQGLFAQQWGPAFKSCRVLFVTTAGAGRIKSMLSAQRDVGAPAGLFLYTTAAQLEGEGALAPIWSTINANNVSLTQVADVR